MTVTDVFISYGHGDRQFVERLAGDLRNHGVTVWIDRDEIPVGESLIERIRAGIDNARMFIVVVSRTSVGSRWVRQELDIALHRQIQGHRLRVLPVLLGPIPEDEMPSFLLGRRFADFRDSGKRAYQSAFDDLMRAITDRPPGAQAVAGGGSLPWRRAPSTAFSGARVEKLMIIWTQLAIANAIFAAMENPFLGALIGMGGITVQFPVAVVLSRLLGRDRAASLVLGAVISGFVTGALTYLLVDWAADTGFVYGAFFGASLTSYFSASDKSVSLLRSAVAVAALVAALVFVTCGAGDGLSFCLQFTELGGPLFLAGFTMVFGLGITPGMLLFMKWLDAALLGMGRILTRPGPNGGRE